MSKKRYNYGTSPVEIIGMTYTYNTDGTYNLTFNPASNIKEYRRYERKQKANYIKEWRGRTDKRLKSCKPGEIINIKRLKSYSLYFVGYTVDESASYEFISYLKDTNQVMVALLDLDMQKKRYEIIDNLKEYRAKIQVDLTNKKNIKSEIDDWLK